ncbi:class I SAM-dependent methyltransferase [Photobacterium sp. 53610]|uniref:class I SAM-dependent methyltransferase n=1 Tax=Photobacterium sp. 53610 TaxID=3102789 RepID=UPI002ED8CA68
MPIKDEQGKQNNWRQFYEKAIARKHAFATELAVKQNESGLNVAVDCGCGTGSDMAFLVQQGYQVHGFDINDESVAICHERFEHTPQVNVSQSTFEQFIYPQAGLIIAHASLFFADPIQLKDTWQAITSSIVAGGVFSGDFMGTDDSWASGFHSATAPLSQQDILHLFKGFEIVQFQERNEPGTTLIGKEKHWHTFSVVAIKPR